MFDVTVKDNEISVVSTKDNNQLLLINDYGNGPKVGVSSALPVDVYDAYELVTAYMRALELVVKPNG